MPKEPLCQSGLYPLANLKKALHGSVEEVRSAKEVRSVKKPKLKINGTMEVLGSAHSF